MKQRKWSTEALSTTPKTKQNKKNQKQYAMSFLDSDKKHYVCGLVLYSIFPFVAGLQFFSYKAICVSLYNFTFNGQTIEWYWEIQETKTFFGTDELCANESAAIIVTSCFSKWAQMVWFLFFFVTKRGSLQLFSDNISDIIGCQHVCRHIWVCATT